MNCPVIQTSGGTSYIEGLEDRTFQYVLLRSLDRGGDRKRPRASRSAPNSASRCITAAGATGTKNEAIRKWIYVEQDPTAIGVNRPIDVPLVGDLRGVVPQLVAALKDDARCPRPPASPSS